MGQICRKDGGDWLIERVGREKHLKTALDWVCACGRCMAWVAAGYRLQGCKQGPSLDGGASAIPCCCEAFALQFSHTNFVREKQLESRRFFSKFRPRLQRCFFPTFFPLSQPSPVRFSLPNPAVTV